MKEIARAPLRRLLSSPVGSPCLPLSRSLFFQDSLSLSLSYTLSRSLVVSPSLRRLSDQTAIVPSPSRLLSLYREIGDRRGVPGARGGSFPPVTEELRVPLNMHEELRLLSTVLKTFSRR